MFSYSTDKRDIYHVVCHVFSYTNIKHLSVSLITDITFIQARQAISVEPKASQRYCLGETE